MCHRLKEKKLKVVKKSKNREKISVFLWSEKQTEIIRCIIYGKLSSHLCSKLSLLASFK